MSCRLGIERAIIVGHSLGSAFANYALSRDRARPLPRFRGAVLLDPIAALLHHATTTREFVYRPASGLADDVADFFFKKARHTLHLHCTCTAPAPAHALHMHMHMHIHCTSHAHALHMHCTCTQGSRTHRTRTAHATHTQRTRNARAGAVVEHRGLAQPGVSRGLLLP